MRWLGWVAGNFVPCATERLDVIEACLLKSSPSMTTDSVRTQSLRRQCELAQPSTVSSPGSGPPPTAGRRSQPCGRVRYGQV